MLDSGKIRVGVLRGGTSPEYKVSLETGKYVLDNLSPDSYKPIDIFISRDGAWHEGGLDRSPESILRKVDVAFNALHGSYGEDGKLQQILEGLGVAYTGSRALSSAMGMNKIASKKIYRDNGLKTPFSVSIPFESLSREIIREVFETVPMPFVVKPATSGSSIGLNIANSLPELEEAVIAAFEYSPQVLIEEFIKGAEVTSGVIEDWRGEEYYNMIPESSIPLSKEESKIVKEASELAHKILGLKHYSSSDFIVHPKRGVFILETDILPVINDKSFIKNSLHSIGSKVSDFLHHIVSLALNKK